jgi:hypothetical protein
MRNSDADSDSFANAYANADRKPYVHPGRVAVRGKHAD